MGEMVSVSVTISLVLVISFVWKLFCWVWLNPKRMEKCLSKQGIKGTPYKFLFGDMKELQGEYKVAKSKPTELSHKIVPRVMPFHSAILQKSGKMCYTWFGPIPRLIIMDPNMMREILLNKSGHFGKTRNPLVVGLVSYEGEKWVKHRRIINPAFHIERLKMMLPAFYTSCSDLINKWQSLIPGESFELDVWPYLQKLTANVISRTAFGSSYEEGQRIFQLQTEQAELFFQAMQFIFVPGFRFLPTKKNNRMKETVREVRTILTDVIIKKKIAIKIGEAKTDDLLGLLMESNFNEIKDSGDCKNVGMTIDDIIDECRVFYFAGQETVSTLLVWTMIVLSMHPGWQEKAREEVSQIFGKRTPDFEGLNHLKIVTMILHEVLRLYPSNPMLLRTTYKETKLGEVILPPGVHIAMPTLLVNHNRELWGEDAEEFNPDRFSGGLSKATNDQVSFFPFGWGPRICIGQNFALLEAKMAMTMILQHFSFELSPTYVHAPYAVATLQPQHGAQLILHNI